MSLNVLARNIKFRRKALKLSQDELAEMVGYSSKSMISKIERGEINITHDKILKIADALECSVNYLMGTECEDAPKFDAANPNIFKNVVSSLLELNEDGLELVGEFIDKMCSKEKYKRVE